MEKSVYCRAIDDIASREKRERDRKGGRERQREIYAYVYVVFFDLIQIKCRCQKSKNDIRLGLIISLPDTIQMKMDVSNVLHTINRQ